MLLKVNAPPGGQRTEIRELVDIFRGRIVDVGPDEGRLSPHAPAGEVRRDDAPVGFDVIDDQHASIPERRAVLRAFGHRRDGLAGRLVGGRPVAWRPLQCRDRLGAPAAPRGSRESPPG